MLEQMNDLELQTENNMRLVDNYNDMNDDQKVKFCKDTIIPGDFFGIKRFDEFFENKSYSDRENSPVTRIRR